MTKAITDLNREELLQLVNDMGQDKSSQPGSRRLGDYEVPQVPLGLRIMKPMLITLVLAVLGSLGIVILFAAFTS